MADDNDWKKLSTEEKVEHKNWKARVEGYEECIKLFRGADDPKNPIYMNYLGLLKKFVIDSNEAAKERGLEAVLSYIENIPAGAKTVGEVMPGLVAKCLNGRQKSREKAIEIILMYIEIEKQDVVQEELAKGFENNQPKVVQACLEIMRTAINLFGSKVVPIKPIIKHVPKLLEHKEKTVRDECKLLAVEMYRWAGQAILPQLQTLKPLVMQELEEEFKQIQEKPRQVRFLRSQQDLRAKMEAEAMEGGSNGVVNGDGAGGAADNGIAAEQEEMDPYDLLEPMDLMSKIPKDYKEKVESKKWQERKEIIDQILGMVQKNPRLTPAGDYYELVTDLKKMVGKDSNVNIVMTAAKCLAAIANALRKDFSKYAISAIEPCMERFKEKKQNVIDALREACDAIYPSTNLEAIQEMCAGFLAHKTPVVRQQVALFLARCFSMCTQNTLPKKLLKLYLPPLIKNLSEADPSVRESSSEALGALYKALGEKIFLANAGEIEAIKLDKIKECADKCVLLNLKGQPRAGSASAPAAAAPSGPAIVKPTTSGFSSATMVKKPAITKPTTDNKPAKAGSDASKPKSDGAKKTDAKKPQANPNAIPDEPDLSDDVVEERARELFGSEVIDQLSNSNWKERQSAIESMMNTIKRQVPEETPVQVIVRIVAVRKPGLKDAHFQCLKQRLELIAHVADISAGFKFTQRSASYCLAEVADKIGDVKIQQQAKEVLSRVADHCTLALVCSICMQPVFVDGKNPKNQEAILNWLTQAIKDFGPAGLDMKALLSHCKLAVQHSNAAVRGAAIPLIVTVCMYSPQFRGHFDQEKPALLKEIDQELEKIRGEQPPAPIRGRNLQSASRSGGGGGSGDSEAPEAMDEEAIAAQQEALITRSNISNLIDDKLIEQLNNKEWKERQAGLEKLDTILRENKFIEPQIGELPVALAKRMLDTNKILTTSALNISEKLAQALGRQGRIFISALAPSMIQALSDAKASVREASVKSLTAWFDNCGGLSPFVENELLLESLTKAKNPNIQAEMCGWLSQVLTKTKPSKNNGSGELKAIVPIVFAYIEDRNPEVRSRSQELIMPLMMHVGQNEMLRVMQKAKPTSLAILQPLIEKARAEIQAKQPAPAPKPVEQPTGPKIVKPIAKNLYEDNDDYNEKPVVETKKEPAKPAGKVVKETKQAESAKSAPAAPAPSTKKKGAEEEDQSPIMQVSNKQKRMDEEKALKTLKWNFEMPRKEFIDQLRTQMEVAGFNSTLVAGMFKDDFKFFMKTLDLFIKALDEFPDATVSNLDLILRWLTLRFFETNPTVILKAIDYMQALFAMLAARNYHMVEYEAAAFLPYFINKGFGDRQDSIRKGFRQITKQIMQVYPPVKIFNQLLTVGLASKNARQRAECLEELGQMIESFGLNTFNPSVTLKEIAKQISDRDNSVRSAALNTITIAHQFAGEQVYKFIGKINDKELSMLDERIKRSGKQPITLVKTSMSGGALSSAQQAQPSVPQFKPQTNGIHVSSSASNLQQQHPESSRLNSQTITRTPKKYGQQSPTQPIVSSSGITAPTINMSPPSVNGNGHHYPAPNPTTPSRRGEFTLDIDDDDDHYKDHISVKLTRHNDIDDLLYKPPELPPKKTQKSFPVNLLKETQDVKGAIDMVITHIAHHDLKTSIQSLLQVDVVIKDKQKRPLLAPHVDNLLNTCSHKIIVAHNIYKTSLDHNVEDILKLYKALFHCIMDLFDTGLGKTASVKSFKDLFYSLLTVMSDPKLAAPESSRASAAADGDQLVKAINFVILKIIDCSNQTVCFSALIRLLTECCADQSQDSVENKYRDLVMKCVWRQIRRLSPDRSAAGSTPTATLDDGDDQHLVRQLYAEIHHFLTTYPSSWWPGKPSDLPLRTVKTLIFHVAKAKRDTVLQDLEALQIPDDSEMKAYVVKLMRNGFEVKSNPSNNTFNTSAAVGGNTSFGFAPSSHVTSLNGGTNNISQLNVIIRKISNADQEISREGLNELYEFKKRNPEIEVNRYFKNCSGQLLAYIDENMKRIEDEKSNGGIGLLQKSPSYGRLSPSRSDLVNEIGETSRPSTTSSSTSGRKITDLKRTMADWKSKTQLNDENMADGHLRSGGAPTNLNRMVSGSNGGLFQASTSGQNTRVFGNDANNVDLDKFKNILKKYTRSRTENLNEGSSNHSIDTNHAQLFQPVHHHNESRHHQQSAATDTQSSQADSTPEKSNGENGNSNGGAANYAQMSSENLYNEYKRRLEQIKKTVK